jgi:hypothetical protein
VSVVDESLIWNHFNLHPCTDSLIGKSK